MSTSSSEPHKEQEPVITPGGLHAKDRVHLVHPGATISFNEARSDDASLSDASESKQKRDTDMTATLILTPGGYRDRSRIHLVQPGQSVDAGGAEPLLIERELSMRGRLLESIQRPQPPGNANWISAAWWLNTTGAPITSFRTTWTVPPVPLTQASQLIYLFNGLQPPSGAAFLTIIQPVLQWGDSGADEDGVQRTGPFWTIASWIVPDASGNVHHTPHVRVNPGDVLVGVMTLTGPSGALFTYSCEFQGIAGTNFTVTNLPQLAWAVETLEAYENGTTKTPPYDLNTASEYPDTDHLAFQGISIEAGSALSSLNWQADDYVSTFGEHTTIANPSPSSGEVDIYFGWGTWQQLQGGGLTTAGPGVAAFGGRIYGLVRGTDNGIYANWTSDGTDWGNWYELQGGGRTTAGPGVAAFNGRLYALVQGTDNRIYANSTADGAHWGAWVQLQGGGLTTDGPGVATFGGRLGALVRGTDNRIYANWTSDGTHWGSWIPLQGNGLTTSAPGVAVFGGRLYALVRGTDNRIYSNWTSDGTNWNSWTVLQSGGLTPAGPGVAAFNGRLYSLVQGSDNRIYANWTSDGTTWGTWAEVQGGGLTTSGPGVATFDSELYALVRGTDNRIYWNRLSA
jgi:hypothetical protein